MDIKLDHINLTVGSLEESIDWYGKVFGFELVEQGIKQDQRRWGILAKNDSMICMNEFPGRKKASEAPAQGHHRTNHFGIRISDLKEWEATVARYQLKLYYDGVNEYPHSKSWYVHDPSGHEIEVSYSGGAPLRFPE